MLQGHIQGADKQPENLPPRQGLPQRWRLHRRHGPIKHASDAQSGGRCRDGEASRLYLIECFETYASRHMTEGFEATGIEEELDIIRQSVDTGSRTLDDLDM